MRSFFLAALAALTFGFLGAQSALADWREGILGVPVYSSKSITRQPSATSGRRARRRSARKARPATRRRSVRRRYTSRRSVRRSSRRRVARAKTRRSRRTARRRSRRVYSGGKSLKGLASYYWQRQRVAAGGWFNPNALTAAHKSLPFGTRVRVTNLRNGRSVVVRINDRGPYIRGRIIDLSRRAATVVGMRNSGVVPVHVQVLGRG